jgi:ribonuclease R
MARPKTPKSARFAKGLPDRDALLQFIRDSGETDKGAIARAFGLKGEDRRQLRAMLQALEADGTLGRRGRRGLAEAGALPEVGVADVVEKDADGDLLVRLTRGEDAPLVPLAPGKDVRGAAPGLGDRLLVRFVRLESGEMEARLIKRLGQSAHRVLGVVRKARREIRVEPVDRRSKDGLVLPPDTDVRDGDLVLTAIEGHGPRYGPKQGKLLEVVGREDEPRAASLIAIHAHGIPMGFSPGAEAEAEAAEPPTLSGREDLRDVPQIGRASCRERVS